MLNYFVIQPCMNSLKTISVDNSHPAHRELARLKDSTAVPLSEQTNFKIAIWRNCAVMYTLTEKRMKVTIKYHYFEHRKKNAENHSKQDCSAGS